LFYQITDDLSFDLGVSVYQNRYSDGSALSVTATYIKAMYNLGKGRLIPHIGVEYVNMPINDDGDMYYTSGTAIFFGGEFTVIEGLSIIGDVKLANKSDLTDDNSTDNFSSLNAYPFIAIRWYI
jgi:hypothetical protein